MQLIAERLLTSTNSSWCGKFKTTFLEENSLQKDRLWKQYGSKKYRNFLLITNLILLVHILHSDLSYQVIQMILQVQHQVLEFT